MPDTVEIGGIEQRAGARIERAERRDADADDRPVGPLQQTAAQAREQLMTIVGVGPKVADCALLYGLHRLEAFPMDVWMKRAMKEWFPGKKPEDFGPYAGVAQQYLFHYIRTAAPDGQPESA